jgi:hypothetical protein
MVPLHFNFKDIFRAPKLAFATKKIWIHFSALFYGLFIYNVLTYVAALLSNIDIKQVWYAYHFFPCPYGSIMPMDFNWYSWVLYWIGIASIVILWYLTFGAVSKITIEQLRGNDFYSRKEAWGFVGKNWKAMVASPIALIILVIILFVGGMILGAWQEIPYVGELTTSLLLIPVFIVSLFFVLSIIIIFISFVLSPAIVGTTKNDTFETMFELYSTFTSQSWRYIVYQFILFIIQPIATIIFFIFSFISLRVIFNAYYYASKIVHTPDKLQTIFSLGKKYIPHCPFYQYLPAWCKDAYFSLMNIDMPFGCGNYTQNLIAEPNWAISLSGLFVGLGFTLIILFIIAYYETIFSVGQTLIYTILRMKKDDENLLEVFDEDFEEPIIPERDDFEMEDDDDDDDDDDDEDDD